MQMDVRAGMRGAGYAAVQRWYLARAQRGLIPAGLVSRLVALRTGVTSNESCGVSLNVISLLTIRAPDIVRAKPAAWTL